jgi:hypothetical protein
MGHPVEHGANRLLHQMGCQAGGKFEPVVGPTAAQNLNIDSESPVYEEAVNRQPESAHSGQTHNPALGTTVGAYRLMEEDMAKARELRRCVALRGEGRPSPHRGSGDLRGAQKIMVWRTILR